MLTQRQSNAYMTLTQQWANMYRRLSNDGMTYPIIIKLCILS